MGRKVTDAAEAEAWRQLADAARKVKEIQQSNGSSRKKKIDRVIQWLTEGHLWKEGGYPYDHRIIGEKLVVASLDGGVGTVISVYDVDSLPAWYNRAVRYLREDGQALPRWPLYVGCFGRWAEAFIETGLDDEGDDTPPTEFTELRDRRIEKPDKSQSFQTDTGSQQSAL